MPADAVFDQPGQRILEAWQRTGDASRVTGWASLHLAGARWFEGSGARGELLPVQLRIGPDRRMANRPGLLLDRGRILEAETVTRHGVLCLNVHRSLFDEVVCRGELRSGVAAIDMVLHAELTTRDRLRAWLGTVTRTPGLPLVRRALDLSVEGAESPPEVALRLTWRGDAELPEPLSNVPIHDRSGRFLGRPDLVCPELGVAAEYDGAHHLSTSARSRDITREGGLRDAGLEVVSVVGGELWQRDLVVRRLHAAVQRVAASTLPKAWVLHGPNGPAPDLAARFDSHLSRMSRARREAALADAPLAVPGSSGVNMR